MLYATVAALAASLIFFIWVALRERRPSTSLDDYLTARGSQGATTLGLSFLASGLGGWILFVPPEIGAFVGPVALVGYALAAALPPQFTEGKVLLAGEDVSDEIRTEAAGMDASRVSTLPAVREALLALQQRFRQLHGLVADGRDMGTVIFPDATLKVFLTASAAERAERRH
eukprot:gene32531-55025_t